MRVGGWSKPARPLQAVQEREGSKDAMASTFGEEKDAGGWECDERNGLGWSDRTRVGFPVRAWVPRTASGTLDPRLVVSTKEDGGEWGGRRGGGGGDGDGRSWW
jgi:hypothetical protein